MSEKKQFPQETALILTVWSFRGPEILCTSSINFRLWHLLHLLLSNCAEESVNVVVLPRRHSVCRPCSKQPFENLTIYKHRVGLSVQKLAIRMFQIVTQHREVRVTGKLFSGLKVRTEKNAKPII